MYSDYGSNDYDKDIKILEDKYKDNEHFRVDPKTVNKFVVMIAEAVVQYVEDVDEDVLSEADYFSILRSIILRSIIGRHFNLTFVGSFLHKISYLLEDLNYAKNTSKISVKTLQKEVGKLNTIFNDQMEGWRSESKENNPVSMMWNITRELSQALSNNAKQASTKWNLILSKDLGYSGFADKSAKGYIHPSEPMQAVFLNTKAFTLLHRVENVSAKKNIDINNLKDYTELQLKMLKLDKKEHVINEDGVDFKGHVDISNKGLVKIPIKFGIVLGNFNCYMNKLKSLVNSPDRVSEDFICDRNRDLKSLEGLPVFIGGDLIIPIELAKTYSEKDIRKISKIRGKVIYEFMSYEELGDGYKKK
jgi:hypothetical protein